MSLLNIPIPNLLNGVSQQPANLRFPTQCEIQENAYSSIVDGLGKRAPTEHVAEIDQFGWAGKPNVKIHVIDRGDASERYVVILNGAADNTCVRVYKNDGTPVTVTFSNTSGEASFIYSYLADVVNGVVNPNFNPNTDLKLVSIADYTFIVNTNRTVEMEGNTDNPERAPEALVWIKQGAYSTKYSILGDNDAEHVTGPNTLGANYTRDGEYFPSTTSDADAHWIAANLVANPNAGANILSTSGWTVQRTGYSIYITRASNFDISVSDGLGGNGLGLISGSVQTFSDLPAVAKHGMVAEVSGLPEQDADNYWVKFTSTNTAGNAIGEGSWAETVKPGIANNLRYRTMPVVLIRQSDGTFMCKLANGITPANAASGADYSYAKWSPRTCGDGETNPQPSFVGGKINDIFLFRGRLGILSGENVVLSEVGGFFNFWRTTVTQIVDTDPIDVASSYPSITLFRHAVPFSDRLVLFSDRVQFVLGTRQSILTASNVSITPTANYDCLKTCRPVAVNDGIFFIFDRGNYSGMRQMVVNTDDSETLTAPDISAHIPKYIPGSVFEIAASSHDNLIACLASGDQSSLYIYKWYDTESERVQSSWSKWTFNGAIIRGMAWLQSSLYIVLERGGVRFLEKITVEPNRKDQYSKFVLALDRRCQPTSASYNASTDRTTFQLPYLIPTGISMTVAKKATLSSEGGYVLPILSTTNIGTAYSTVTVSGNWAANTVWVGEQYIMKYRFTQPYLKQSDGSRSVSLSSGRFQVRNMNLVYDNTSNFSVKVTHDFNNTQYSYQWSGNIVGTGQAVIGAVPVESGMFRFPVYAKNNEVVVDIENPTHLPSNFLSAEIEASYDSRSRRV